MDDKTIIRENDSFDEFDEEDAFGLGRESEKETAKKKKSLKTLFSRKKVKKETETSEEDVIDEDDEEEDDEVTSDEQSEIHSIKMPRMRTLRIVYAVLAIIATTIIVYIGVVIAYHVILDHRMQKNYEDSNQIGVADVVQTEKVDITQSSDIARGAEGELFYADYLLPESSTSYLSKSDLQGLTKTQLEIARNEIYARHGLLFADAYLATYFESCKWYHGSVTAVTSDMLNEYEKANISLILELESE